MGIILELGLGLALGVVGVPVLVGHSELPSGAIVAVSRMPLALNLEVGRSCSAANNCVVDPIPPVEDDAFGLRNFWAWDRTFAVRRDVNPASSAPRFFRSECGYAGPRSPNIFECDANDLASAFRSTQVHYLRGDYPKNGSFGTNESLMRLIGVDRSTARIERGGNGRSHRDEAQSYTTSGGSKTTLTDTTTEKDRQFHQRKENSLIKMFFAKFFLLNQVLQTGWVVVVIVAIISSIISIGYYFKIIF